DLTSLLPEPIAQLQKNGSFQAEPKVLDANTRKVSLADSNMISPEDAMRIGFLKPRLPHDAKPIDFVKSSVEKCEQIAKDSPKFGTADAPALMGPSTITADFIEKDLLAVGSPYANKGMGKEFIDAAKLSGVNAAYIYAKFAYESSWGKNPNHSERTTNNLKHFNFGNQKDHIAMAAHGGEIDRKFDTVRPDGKPGTRADGILALALHVKEMYGNSREKGGVDVKSPRELICHYAPDSENNGKAYTKFMVDKVNLWDKATRAERSVSEEAVKVAAQHKVAEPVKATEERKIAETEKTSEKEKSKVVESSAKDHGFKLPDSVNAKAHTGEGQGYYQPIKASIQELLGRKMSEGETRAAIAAARALRHENGEPMNRLNKDDMLLPTSKESAEMFLRNIGNGKFGHQVMSKEKIEKFKNEITEKFSMPSPQAKVEAPKKIEPSTEESSKKVSPLTAPHSEAAQNTEPLRVPSEKLNAPLAPLTDMEPDSRYKLHPGDLNLNAQIVAIAGGSPSDGATVLSSVAGQRNNKISEPAGLNKDLPVAVVPGMKAGSLGLIAHVDDKGQEHLVPFVAGTSTDAHNAKKAVLLNDAAARELGISSGTQHSRGSNQIDVIMLKADGAPLPKDLQTLSGVVSERLKEIASKPDVLEKAEKNLAGKEVIESAYIPKPDAEFGYRRTERSSEELSRISEKFQAEAAKNHELAESLKPGSKDAPALVQTVLKEAQTEKSRLEREKTAYTQLHALLKSGTTASQLSDEFISKLPPVLGRDLAKAKYNRDVAQKNTDSANNPFQTGFGLDIAQKTKFENAAKLAMSYVKTQEERALKNAAHLVLLSSDKKVLQDRIIADATDPKHAQDLLQHRFAMKAVAAEMLAANPDLAAGGGKAGALQGIRVVVNGGHDPYHGSRTPGFGAYEWSKTKDNPKGMTEYDFNKETSAILGSLVEYSGGVPIYVHQDELYKSNPRTQSMGALAAAMEAPKADVMISNHMDDDNGIKPGTLTLVNSQSHRLGALINQAKGSIGVEPTKPLKEQSRGVQSHLHGNGVLNEILTTAPQDRAKLMNPRELAKLQLGVVVGMDRFFHPPGKAKLNAEIAKDKQSGSSWESFWANRDSKSNRVTQSVPYPRMDK
ncbi:MAG: N-acetylmuramoyl-L-alanine amidase, partial [Candidatus Obscuribacterales bacterium]|nr:N-acetylmuramoyl-L-alanine amidase [Candidatus Obscuribacterales bacterium]